VNTPDAKDTRTRTITGGGKQTPSYAGQRRSRL